MAHRSPEKVLLAHGMGRNAASILLVGRRLKEAKLPPVMFDYALSMEPLDVIADRLVWTARRKLRRPFALVAYALGGVLVRMVAEPLVEAGLVRLVLVGTPKHSPEGVRKENSVLSKAFQENPVLRAITENHQSIPEIAPIQARVPIAEIPTLLVGSGHTPRSVWVPFQGPEKGLSDGSRALPGIHAWRAADRNVTDEMLRFLREDLG